MMGVFRGGRAIGASAIGSFMGREIRQKMARARDAGIAARKKNDALAAKAAEAELMDSVNEAVVVLVHDLATEDEHQGDDEFDRMVADVEAIEMAWEPYRTARAAAKENERTVAKITAEVEKFKRKVARANPPATAAEDLAAAKVRLTKAMTAATSSGLARRPMGCLAITAWRMASMSLLLRNMD